MSVEYLVVQAEAQDGPFARVTAHKLHQSWETLQAALDELGQQGWDLCTTIYSATREHRGPGEHYCEGLIFKRMASSAEASAIVTEALDIVEREGNGH
jgi:hypothetical protein